MLELIDVWKGPKRVTSQDECTLAGVTLTIPSGRRIGLLGSDADNNSMVLRMLSGMEEPDKGVLRRVGTPCWPLDYSGFTDNSATLRQNASFLGRIYGVDADEMTRIAGMLSGVRPVRGRPMRQYSGVDRRALELGLTLSLQFDWYFVDEKLPKALDGTEDAIHAAITDRISRASLVWASSNAKFLSEFCDAGLLLDQGKLTFYDRFEEAAAAYTNLNPSQVKARNEDDGQSGGNKRRRRAARRARQNGLEEPV